MKKIVSLQNPLIKEVLKLQEKSRERKKKGLFIIEGKREITLAISGNYKIKTLLFNSDLISINNLKVLNSSDAEVIEISNDVYQKLAYRDSTEGVIAIVFKRDFSLENVKFKNKNPLLLVFEAIEKPGNIGALLRTADAANVDAVLIANPKSDIYNPNIVRSSVGCLFTNQIGIGTSEEVVEFLKRKKINIFSATLQNSNEYFKEDFTKPSAIIVGTEATGLIKIWRDTAFQNINIPMQGKIDSMNVSVAAAIIIFEAKRQRNFS